MSEGKLLTVGVIGAVVAVICSTPAPRVLLGALGLSHLLSVLDYVLLPALLIFVGLIIYGVIRKSWALAKRASRDDGAPVAVTLSARSAGIGAPRPCRPTPASTSTSASVRRPAQARAGGLLRVLLVRHGAVPAHGAGSAAGGRRGGRCRPRRVLDGEADLDHHLIVDHLAVLDMGRGPPPPETSAGRAGSWRPG